LFLAAGTKMVQGKRVCCFVVSQKGQSSLPGTKHK
jgi:hypothetical protein